MEMSILPARILGPCCVALVLGLLLTVFGYQGTASADELSMCKSKEIGVDFFCDPAWQEYKEGRKLTVTVNKKPLVQLYFEESVHHLHFLSEVDRRGLESLGQYAPGFEVKRLTYCNRETIKVDGYLKVPTNTKVSDFYVQDHNQLHMVRFLVRPKEAWDDYNVLFSRIAGSIKFTGRQNEIKLVVSESGTCEDLVK